MIVRREFDIVSHIQEQTLSAIIKTKRFEHVCRGQQHIFYDSMNIFLYFLHGFLLCFTPVSDERKDGHQINTRIYMLIEQRKALQSTHEKLLGKFMNKNAKKRSLCDKNYKNFLNIE